VRFSGIGLAGIVVQLAAIAVLTDALGVHYLPATALAVTLAVVHNFVWHVVWTWGDRRTGNLSSALARFVVANGLVSLVGNLAVMLLFTGALGMPAVPANTLAIASSGLVNFVLADSLVFRARPERARAPSS
jgi:dolichol-phosphate mannosyltransferase